MGAEYDEDYGKNYNMQQEGGYQRTAQSSMNPFDPFDSASPRAPNSKEAFNSRR